MDLIKEKIQNLESTNKILKFEIEKLEERIDILEVLLTNKNIDINHLTSQNNGLKKELKMFINLHRHF